MVLKVVFLCLGFLYWFVLFFFYIDLGLFRGLFDALDHLGLAPFPHIFLNIYLPQAFLNAQDTINRKLTAGKLVALLII
jgi:hypothetical protein